jgi:Ca2+-binding EF-hand superfamily protein
MGHITYGGTIKYGVYMSDLTDEDIEEIEENFDYFDSDNNGRIDYGEFVRLIGALDGDMSEEEMKTGFDIVDSDNNGYIDLDEFIEWWGDR